MKTHNDNQRTQLSFSFLFKPLFWSAILSVSPVFICFQKFDNSRAVRLVPSFDLYLPLSASRFSSDLCGFVFYYRGESTVFFLQVPCWCSLSNFLPGYIFLATLKNSIMQNHVFFKHEIWTSWILYVSRLWTLYIFHWRQQSWA